MRWITESSTPEREARAVVVRVVPGVVVDIGVVVVDDGRTAATTPTAATERGANGDTSSKVEAEGSYGKRRTHVERHHHGRARSDCQLRRWILRSERCESTSVAFIATNGCFRDSLQYTQGGCSS